MDTKVCGCGATYDAVAWNRLVLVGHQDDGEGGELELRNCPCGSTLAIEAAEPQIARCARCGSVEPLQRWHGRELCIVCACVADAAVAELSEQAA